jgi:hypothetical protein
MPEGDQDLLGIPSLTAGGARTNYMSTPRQLDSFMHGVEPNQDDGACPKVIKIY